ncbi:MAG: hypothetical protein HY871_01180 [Chloroflexi bacterium]|nr:hypothetical protein [Chloroflexota bacterium]
MKPDAEREKQSAATSAPTRDRPNRLPLIVGGVCFGVAAILSIVGLVFNPTGTTPFSWRSLFLAMVIGGGSWGLIGWAITSAVVEVEKDVSESEEKGS